jgi:hypothetical protein
MAGIGSLRRNWVELAWAVFAVANLVAMALVPSWETIPFHFIWISLTLVYGFRVWSPGNTGFVLGLVIAATGALILSDAFSGEQLWGELFEVPLMSAMFLAMVWHARRRQDAVRDLQAEASERAELLVRAGASRGAAARERLRRPGGRDRARRARTDREDPRATAVAGQVEAA